MAAVKAEAGGVEPDPIPGGAAAVAQGGTVQLSGRTQIGVRGAAAIAEPGDSAKFEGVAGQGQVGGGDRAVFRGVVGTGEAGNLAPLTVDSTAQVINNARADITLQAAVSVETEVIRAPFSPTGIAEEIARDPERYLRLFEFASSELTREIARYHGQGNADLVVRGELVKLERGFAEIAKLIAAKLYDAAASAIVSLRDGLVAFDESHPELVEIFLKLGAVSLSTYTLGLVGVSPWLGALVTASVVNKEKLADILKFWKGK